MENRGDSNEYPQHMFLTEAILMGTHNICFMVNQGEANEYHNVCFYGEPRRFYWVPTTRF